MGGLGISNITETSELEYSNSVLATTALADAIFHQQSMFCEDDIAQHEMLNNADNQETKRSVLHSPKTSSDG